MREKLILYLQYLVWPWHIVALKSNYRKERWKEGGEGKEGKAVEWRGGRRKEGSQICVNEREEMVLYNLLSCYIEAQFCRTGFHWT